MSFFSVPPPYDDDHEDVAWALRAASAQWKRDAHQDAIHWVRRASETAQEVGAVGRAQELSRLATVLTNASMPAVAPPPPPGAVAPAPLGAHAPPPVVAPALYKHSGPVSVDYEVVDVDVELDELDEDLEDLDDDGDIELLDDDAGVEEVDEVLDATPAPASLGQDPRQLAAATITGTGYRPVPPPSLPPPSLPHQVRPKQGGRTASSVPPASERRRPDSQRLSERPTVAPTEGQSSRPASRRGRSATRSDSSPPRSAGSRRISSAPAQPEERSRSGRTTTSPKLDRIPPSMRPEPSGIDLDEEIENELDAEGRRSRPPSGDEFGELQFSEEAVTNRRGAPSLPPPIPDLGPLPLETSSVLPIEDQTAAEYAQGKKPLAHDHEALEKELGVDLSVRGVKLPSPPPASHTFEDDADTFRPSRYPSSMPPGVISAAPSAIPDPEIPELSVNAPSPIPGRAAASPTSRSISSVPRLTSAGAEPYGLAPSASLPPVATTWSSIEPPSRPTQAPPPSSMSEPDQGRGNAPSILPSVGLPNIGLSEIPPASAAPDADEFEELFSKISIPPGVPRGRGASTSDADSVAPPQRSRSIPASPLMGDDGSVMVDGLDLMAVDGFQDLPEESAMALAERAELRTLHVQEEITGFGLAIVTHGAVSLMPAVANATCRVARKGEVLFTQGTLEGSAAVRVVGLEEGSRVAVFAKSDLDRAVESCPWVGDELAAVADTHLAFAGAVLGPLGHSLDEMFRFMVLEKCVVKRKGPRDVIAVGGKAMDGMYILGGGSLEVVDEGGNLLKLLSMGDFLFPETVLSAAPAAHTVRAGARGALVLYAPRKSAHELLATCPPFIELLAG